MPDLRYTDAARRIVPTQRCAHGDDARGYCEKPATVHLWTHALAPDAGDGHTMACDEHCPWFDTRREYVVDHHPVTGPCGMPDTEWITSHPTGGPGWCEMPGLDWLAAVEAAPIPAEVHA